jgi:hypothetical protein
MVMLAVHEFGVITLEYLPTGVPAAKYYAREDPLNVAKQGK